MSGEFARKVWLNRILTFLMLLDCLVVVLKLAIPWVFVAIDALPNKRRHLISNHIYGITFFFTHLRGRVLLRHCRRFILSVLHQLSLRHFVVDKCFASVVLGSLVVLWVQIGYWDWPARLGLLDFEYWNFLVTVFTNVFSNFTHAPAWLHYCVCDFLLINIVWVTTLRRAKGWCFRHGCRVRLRFADHVCVLNELLNWLLLAAGSPTALSHVLGNRWAGLRVVSARFSSNLHF